MTTLRIATRESPLAMWQAHAVRDLLLAAHPESNVILVPMTTAGDQTLGALNKIGGKGLFTKELEQAKEELEKATKAVELTTQEIVKLGDIQFKLFNEKRGVFIP